MPNDIDATPNTKAFNSVKNICFKIPVSSIIKSYKKFDIEDVVNPIPNAINTIDNTVIIFTASKS